MNLEQRVATLERELADLRARENIRRVLARYAWGLDEGRLQELEEIFTDDAVLETIPWGSRPVEGKARVMRAFDNYRATFSQPRRFIADEEVHPQGERATARAYWFVFQSRQGESYLGWGTYDWELRREGAQWKISHMVVRLLTMTTLERGWGMEENRVLPLPRRG